MDSSKVFYICDREACGPCKNPECNHTDNIEHAKNFKSNEELGMHNGYSDYWEVEQDGLDNWVRFEDCPVGLFTFSGNLYTKVGQEVAVRIATGNVEAIHPDILVWPIRIKEYD